MWKNTKGGHPGDEPNLQALGGQDGTLPLRTTLKEDTESWGAPSTHLGR